MVGLSDIPCVGEVKDRISKYVVDALGRGCRYLFCYKDGVNVLNSQRKNLNTEVDRVSRIVKEELANGKRIKDNVIEWQKEAEEVQESGEEFEKKYKNRHSWRCIKRLPIPNPVSRFQLGREAVKKTKKVTEIIESGSKLRSDEIADFPEVPYLPNPDGAFMSFQSRKDAYEELWKALVSTDDSSQFLGIYGMSGVGKTRMAKQIREQAMEERIFKNVIQVDVGSSEILDVLKLQTEIARYLNCNFESHDDVVSRASQLKGSLANGGKILIILDDVWGEIKMVDIFGTSFDDGSISKGSKILLTSRERDACVVNKCKLPVKITPLKDDEAWDLFSNTVGTKKINSLKDKTLAEKICKKCAGLPVIIGAVGKALESMTESVWINALSDLETSRIESVPGISAKVYACLKLSFDNLKHKDAKPCLLLCSLFPEDADIPIKMLILLATGSELVHGGRTGVRAMVDILKSSLLLFKGKDDQHFKLHDIIRDVARSVAIKEYGIILEKCVSQLHHNPAHYGEGKALHLYVNNDAFHFPNNLMCPDLRTLYLRSMAEPLLVWNKGSYIGNLSGGMFESLTFLVLDDFGWLQLQFSLQPLASLRTLFLNHCALHYIDGFPQSLNTLCLWDCQIPQPLNLPELPYLQKLEILRNWDEVQFLWSTVSSLTLLEELHVSKGFSIWDYPNEPILPVIINFTCLRSLQIPLGGYGSLTYTDIFRKLSDFNINVASGNYFPDEPDYDGELTRLIELTGNQLEDFQGLVERAEQVKFRSTNLKVRSIFNSNRKAFADLINLYIEECETMEYIARLSQDEIWHRHPSRTSFSKLTILDITKCYEMKYLFCNYVAKSLVELQELSIRSCPYLEVIVMHEGISDGDIINFSKLKSLKLYTMRSLRSFHGESKETSDISDDDHVQPLFSEMVAFPSLEVLELHALGYTSDLWDCYHYKDNPSFRKLKSLFLWMCNEVKNVIPLAMLHKLQNLETLRIQDCRSVISELGSDNNTEVHPLVALHTMDLNILPCLTHTGLNSSWDHSGAMMTLYPNIQILDIQHCSRMENVFMPFIAKKLVHLKHMWIASCEKISEIVVAGEEEEFILGNVFPELSTLYLSSLPNLTSIWCYRNGKVQFPNLVEGFELHRLSTLRLHRLPNLKGIFHGANYECYMPALNEVDIGDDCGLVSTLFTWSVFCKLQGLIVLRVSGCGMLKGIVEDARGDKTSDKIITLSRLSSVILTNLPNLNSSSIHSSNLEVHMPALEVMSVHNCGLSTLFTCSVLKDLQQLNYLRISSCSLLERIVVDERSDETLNMNDKAITLSQLKVVVLTNLPNLQTFICCANYECYMPALKGVKIVECGLLTIFTRSAFRRLQQLRKIQVSDCRLLKGIVEDTRSEENSDTNNMIFTLNRLSSVIFRDSPNLKSFAPTTGANYAYAYKVKIPNLVNFELTGCGEMNLKTIEFGREDSTCQLTGLKISCNNEIQLPCQWQLQSLNLERLEVLTIDNSGCSALLTFSGFESLQQLQQLEISNCALLKDIVEDVRGDEASAMDKKTVTLSRLESIILKNLPNLKSFIHSANYECHVPGLKKVEVENCGLSALFTCSVFRHIRNLKSLQVSNCTLLKGIVEDEKADETLAMNDKIIKLLALSSVVLNDLPSLKSFFHGANYECCMPGLLELRVNNCGLLTLFTYSAFGDLRQLRNLEVSDCRLLEGIVEDARGEENSGTSNMITTLFQLTSVTLRDLPNLKSFTFTEANAYKVNIPNLRKFELVGCGKINLEAIGLGTDDFTCRLTDLQISCGDERQLPCKWQLQLYNLEKLTLTHCWWHELESLRFQRLKVLKIQNSGCSALFAFSSLRSLEQLQQLEISNCALLEEIAEDVRVDEVSGVDKTTVTFSNLNSVILTDLPKLKNFIHSANYECHMPALLELRVNNCGLSTLFTCSAFTSLQKLGKLEVSDCRLLEDIVEDARGEENSGTSKAMITLYQLSSVILRDLPNLKSFSRTVSYAFNMPKLDHFWLTGCPEVENFTSLKTSTGLVSVFSEWHQGERVPDLSEYITQTRKRESMISGSARESRCDIQEVKKESVGDEDEGSNLSNLSESERIHACLDQDLRFFEI